MAVLRVSSRDREERPSLNRTTTSTTIPSSPSLVRLRRQRRSTRSGSDAGSRSPATMPPLPRHSARTAATHCLICNRRLEKSSETVLAVEPGPAVAARVRATPGGCPFLHETGVLLVHSACLRCGVSGCSGDVRRVGDDVLSGWQGKTVLQPAARGKLRCTAHGLAGGTSSSPVPTCAACSKPITSAAADVGPRSFHATSACFACAGCAKSLVGVPFAAPRSATDPLRCVPCANEARANR